MTRLLDEHSVPSLRVEIGRLLAAAEHADIAVRHIRLAAIDLSREEMRSVRRCRLLLGRLDATELSRFGDIIDPGIHSGPLHEHATQREALLEFLDSGRIHIRSLGLGAWAPDFSVFDLRDGESVCLLGAHYFHQPPAFLGPSFTAMLHDPLLVHAAASRFAELWGAAHDVMEPVRHAVRGALAHAR